MSFQKNEFNLYSDEILREIHVLPGFISDVHNLTNVSYEYDTELIVKTEIKLYEILYEVVE